MLSKPPTAWLHCLCSVALGRAPGPLLQQGCHLPGASSERLRRGHQTAPRSGVASRERVMTVTPEHTHPFPVSAPGPRHIDGFKAQFFPRLDWPIVSPANQSASKWVPEAPPWAKHPGVPHPSRTGNTTHAAWAKGWRACLGGSQSKEGIWAKGRRSVSEEGGRKPGEARGGG